jgi:hypothetical protein
MDSDVTLLNSVMFRPPSIQNQGCFVLHKSIFVVDGQNVPRTYRCDNLTYNVDLPTLGTPYEDEGVYVGMKSKWDGYTLNPNNVSDWVSFLDFTPYFAFTYFKFVEKSMDGGEYEYAPHMHNGITPAILWTGKSLIELLKNMREWTFMLEEPFNSDHPMAIYSKMAFDKLETPNWIFEELDSLPDMHLARFLKGDPNHRDCLEDFPQMSDDLKIWLEQKFDQYRSVSTNQRLRDLII